MLFGHRRSRWWSHLVRHQSIDADATARTAKEFKVLYQKVSGTTPGSYTLDHSAATYVYDPKGRLRLSVGHAQGPEVYAHDLKELLEGK